MTPLRWTHVLLTGLVCQLFACNESPDSDKSSTTSSTQIIPQLPGTQQVTWHQHIAPLVAQKCNGCHVSGGIAPFSLSKYMEAKALGAAMAHEVALGSMPPWGAEDTAECSPPAAFKDDLRLSKDEKALFQSWVDGGLLEGDAQTATPLPAAPQLSISEPTRQLTIPNGVTLTDTGDDFVCFTLDPKITENVWLTGTQVVAGNSAIVHHALVFLDRGGEGASLANDKGQYKCFGSPNLKQTALLGAWAPGAVPQLLPESTGIPLKPGDKLVVQVHYHPTGKAADTDKATRVDLKWVTTEPEYVGAIYLIGNISEVNSRKAGGTGYGLTTGPDFLIPSGATNHQEINRYRLDDGGNPLASLIPLRLWMVGTHMHYVGRDMKLSVTDPSGAERCLLQTPHWDFNWQRGYLYQGKVPDLPTIHLGDSLTMRCTYDNSLSNPFVKEALEAQGLDKPHDVKLGEQTLDEMCLGVFGLAVTKAQAKDLGL